MTEALGGLLGNMRPNHPDPPVVKSPSGLRPDFVLPNEELYSVPRLVICKKELHGQIEALSLFLWFEELAALQ